MQLLAKAVKLSGMDLGELSCDTVACSPMM